MEASSSSSGARPTVWIVIAVICALAAIGLGIWAFTTKSDLDDANATIAKQKKELASSQQAATAEEQQLTSFGRRERAAYRRVRENATAAGLQKKVKDEAAQLQKAQTEVANAQGQDQKEEAQLKQAQAKARLATACSASSVDALNRFFDASTTKAGAKAAVAQLESTQQECQTASGGS